MEQRVKMSRLRPRHVILFCTICLSLLAVVAISQEAKLNEIEQEQAVLTESYEKLLLEEQRLESMIEYAGTDSYVEQIARERLGYVWPEDYKFFKE